MTPPWMARARDPGDEDVVRVVDEVIAREGVDELALAAPVGARDRHELAVAGGGRDGLGPREQPVAVGCEQRGGDEDLRVMAGARHLDDRRDRRIVADHEPVKQVPGVHGSTVQNGADTALTPP